jgi:hypothetical protein
MQKQICQIKFPKCKTKHSQPKFWITLQYGQQMYVHKLNNPNFTLGEGWWVLKEMKNYQFFLPYDYIPLNNLVFQKIKETLEINKQPKIQCYGKKTTSNLFIGESIVK